ncbi:MAG: hypothetical protein K0B15_10325 [Lentimicrobium sp.]|nr:hypothetical protein [Lentimicrobium sp.]
MNPDTSILENLLLREQSRNKTDFWVEILNSKPEFFDEFWLIMLNNIDPVSRRAAWVIDYCSELHPEQLDCRIEELSDNLPAFSSDGLKRHSLRM